MEAKALEEEAQRIEEEQYLATFGIPGMGLVKKAVKAPMGIAKKAVTAPLGIAKKAATSFIPSPMKAATSMMGMGQPSQPA